MGKKDTKVNDKLSTIKDKSNEIDPEVATVIKSLPDKDQKIIIRAIAFSEEYSGPLPDGETIKVYNKVIPNGGDRLMFQVEKQLDHRIKIENNGIRRTYNQSSTGQWMAFFIALFFGAIAWDLSTRGYQVTASILGVIDIVALVTVFITGRRMSSSE